jgi:hypothetical protein
MLSCEIELYNWTYGKPVRPGHCCLNSQGGIFSGPNLKNRLVGLSTGYMTGWPPEEVLRNAYDPYYNNVFRNGVAFYGGFFLCDTDWSFDPVFSSC